jgi:uncharacterized protein (DUF1501 family)
MNNNRDWSSELGSIPTVTRRSLLAALGLGGAGPVAGCSSMSSESRSRSARDSVASPDGGAASPTTGNRSARSAGSGSSGVKGKQAGGRVLVVVELRGGIDGFATLVPYGDSAFRRLRDRIWVDPKDLDVIDDRYAVAKGLGAVKDRLAFVEGVGVANPNLSHFDMMRRWWLGDLDGKTSLATGFLGRCCDRLASGEPITGLSVGGGSTPALLTETAATVSLPALELVRGVARREPGEDRLRKTLRAGAVEENGVTTGAGAEADRLASIARANLGSGLDLLANIERLGDGPPPGYPEGNELADSFAMVSQLISLDAGMQVFHIPWGSFDTHADQVGNHAAQMDQFGIALTAFLDNVAATGMQDRVLVATTSEFGRRVEASGSGTDHGTASTMMLAGAVNPGRHGAPPNFARRDVDGNVKATTALGDYYATLASWLGLAASEVVSSGTPIDSVLSV